MNRSKKLYILLGILVVVCAVTFGVMRMEEYQEQIKNIDSVILELSSDDVQTVSWEYNSQTLAFHKDENWLYDEDDAFPVSEEKINELLDVFQEFDASFSIENAEDLSQYGLDDPICTIKLSTEKESYEVLLGDYSTMDSERYVSIGDGNVYLVENDPLNYFDAELRDMIDNDEIPQIDTADSIQLSGTENYSIFYEEDSAETYCRDDVYFARQESGSRPLDTSNINSWLQSLCNLELSDYVSYNAGDEELQTYGLDDPELTVTVGYTAEDDSGEETDQTFVLHISRDPKEREAAEEASGETAEETQEDAEEEEITAYARVGESKIIYQISSDSYESLMAASYDDLRHKEVLSADFADIQQIDISLEDEVYSILAEGEDDSRIFTYQDEELDITDFQTALETLAAASFTAEEPSDIEEIGLTVHLDNENYPEVSIDLYRYDGSFCLAVIDGEPVSLVERSGVVDLIEAVHAIVLN